MKDYMHEHSFIQAIIKNVKEPHKAKEVSIEVGELAGIEPDHLKDHLREITNWVVNTSSKKSLVYCDCGYKGNPRILERLHDLVIFDCPKCSSIPKIIEGRDIKIISVKY